MGELVFQKMKAVNDMIKQLENKKTIPVLQFVVATLLLVLLLIPAPVLAEDTVVSNVLQARNVTIKKFYVEVKNDQGNSVPMPNSDFRISYSLNNESVVVKEGTTNEKGEILDLTLENIPNEVSTIYVRYYLGTAERGYIQNLSNRKYSFFYSKGIPKSNLIDFSSAATFGTDGDEASFRYNFVAANMNYQYFLAIKDYKQAVQLANELLPKTVSLITQPINVFLQRGEFVDRGNAFYSKGVVNKQPEIIFGDRTNFADFRDWYIKHNMMHEWSHWNMYQTVGLPGKSYETHYTINEQPQTSYKEGWALLMGDLFAKRYDISSQDFANQSDTERLFGKNTNKTVEGILYDLIDFSAADNDEHYSISQRMIEGEINDQDLILLNMGILYTAMVESKANTLKDLLTYIDNRYVITKTDQESFRELLAVNGLTETFDFMY